MTVVKSKFVPLQLAHYCTHQLVPSKDSIQQSSRLSEGDCCHAWNNKVCCCSSYFTISKGQLILAPMHQTVYCSNLRLCWNHFAHDDAPKFPASTALKKKRMLLPPPLELINGIKHAAMASNSIFNCNVGSDQLGGITWQPLFSNWHAPACNWCCQTFLSYSKQCLPCHWPNQYL